MTELGDWDNFYVIVGSAAGGLIGLQFVVLTLIAQKPPRRGAESSAAFGTPTVVHFATVLMLAAAICAPWQTMRPIAFIWGVVGIFGMLYAFIVIMRMRRQTSYTPELEDWLFHVLLPLLAYLALAVSAFAAAGHARDSLFGAGGAALLLLFIGVHNAWDAVVYHVFVNLPRSDS